MGYVDFGYKILDFAATLPFPGPRWPMIQVSSSELNLTQVGPSNSSEFRQVQVNLR